MTGDAIPAGALLESGEDEPSHSITILLPDGQRVLYECFTTKDCARGFRVPSLYRAAEPFAAGMMERIHALLVRERNQATTKESIHQAGRDEAAAELGPDNSIEISGLAAALSIGSYTGDLRPLDARYPRQTGIPLDKSGRSITLTLPGPGLFELTIFDALKTPRIDFLIAAVSSAKGVGIVREFKEAHALMLQWNENYQGWPIHEFQRAYLKSLMLGVRTVLDERAIASKGTVRPGVTAEPAFTPRPGVLNGDAAVTLGCATTDALVHYTVDGSQPFDSSPVYRAPIMVTGPELTIKAFAQSPDRKDSAVVTGIFRIHAR